MKQKIELKNGDSRKAICKALDISSAFLSLALSFKRNSAKALQAREMALRNGGTLYVSQSPKSEIKVLNAKGEIIRVIKDKDVDTHKKFPHIVIKKGTTFSSVQK